jgi:hypothetical protein
MPYTRTIREQLVPCGRSATSRRMVRQTPLGQKQLAKRIEKRERSRTSKEHEEHLDELHLAEGPPATWRTVRQAREQQPKPETERAKPPTRPWISQTVEALEERFGEGVKRH